MPPVEEFHVAARSRTCQFPHHFPVRVLDDVGRGGKRVYANFKTEHFMSCSVIS